MDAMPETKYARHGDEFIAYQTLGAGPPDIVFIRSAWNHLEVQWENMRLTRFLSRLGAIGRLIMFDGRGSGMSDPFFDGASPSIEDWVDDALTVIGEVDSDRAAILCSGITTMRGVLLAASHPNRVSSLIVLNGFARFMQDDDYPFGQPRAVQEEMLARVPENFGRVPREDLLASDPDLARWLTRYARFSSAPGYFLRTAGALSLVADVRDVLPAVRVPTLVVQHEESVMRAVGPEAGRYLADHIEGAVYVQLPGKPVWDWLYPDPDAVAAEIEQFLLGRQSLPEPDRVLATVLFTDIVESTRSTAEAGDRKWRAMLDALDRIVENEVARYRGKVIKSTGDGHLATFDGPGRAIRCADALRERSASIGLTLRAGLHTGEMEVRGNDIGGIAVSIARRVCDTADDGCVFVSSSVPPLVAGSEITFDERGTHELKGVPGTWQLYEVVS